MKKRSNAILLACIPAVFVLILLSTGFPQRFIPAVSVGQTDYTVAQYNFYYYEAYASFVREHADELTDLGLDLTRELKNQRRADGMTWAEYFRVQALTDMQEINALSDAARAEGFDAGERVRRVGAEKTAEIQAYCVTANIKNTETYLTGLYDAGMTEEIFYEELARRTTAEAYREQLTAQIEAEVSAAPSAPSDIGGDYLTADAVIGLFRPGTDRASGQTQEHQWENAELLARAAMDRAAAWGGDAAAYAAAASAYSEMGDDAVPDGHYPALTREDLEGPLEDWCLDPARQPGDTAVLRGTAGWYTAYFCGWGESAGALQARREQTEEAFARLLSDMTALYPVSTHWLGMQIAR